MKTIKTVIEIPDKLKWMAQDANGDWFAYKRKPDTGFSSWLPKGECIQIGRGDSNPDWRETLQRIEEYEVVE